MTEVDTIKQCETQETLLRLPEERQLVEQIRVVGERDGIIEAYVPIALIDTEGSAVDPVRVRELADLLETAGQLSPVLLGHIAGQSKFVGLGDPHYYSAVVLGGHDNVYATIKPDCTPEDVSTIRRILSQSQKNAKGAKSKTDQQRPTRTKEADYSDVGSYAATLRGKLFDDQLELVKALIENAILKGVYRPRVRIEKEAQPRPPIAAIEEDEELPPGSVQWSKESLRDVATKVITMKPFLMSMLRRQFVLTNEDCEDIIQTATLRFLEKINDGRLPEPQNEDHFRRLIARFVTFAVVDQKRKELGREGQKPKIESIHADCVTGGGLTLEDTLAIEDSYDEVEGSSADFIKGLLPFLSGNGRRILIMKLQVGLTDKEIAAILGTTEGTVNQTYRRVKIQARKLRGHAREVVFE